MNKKGVKHGQHIWRSVYHLGTDTCLEKNPDILDLEYNCISNFICLMTNKLSLVPKPQSSVVFVLSFQRSRLGLRI